MFIYNSLFSFVIKCMHYYVIEHTVCFFHVQKYCLISYTIYRKFRLWPSCTSHTPRTVACYLNLGQINRFVLVSHLGRKKGKLILNLGQVRRLLCLYYNDKTNILYQQNA